MIKYLILILLLFISNIVEAKQLYVNDSTGNDATTYANNDSDNPWLTIGRAAWGSTNRAVPVSGEAAAAGDTVNVIAGTYDDSTAVGERFDPIYNPVNAGSSGNPITFLAVGNVVLTSSTSGDGEPLIGAFQKNYITWDGFYLDEANINTAPDTGPVVAWGCTHTTIQNCTIIGVYFAWNDNHVGIYTADADDVTIYNNNISKFRFFANTNDSQNCAGIMMYTSDRMTIYNNTIHDCGSGMYIKVGNTGPYYIYYNLIYNCGAEGIHVQQVTSGEIYQNVIRDSLNGLEIQSFAADFGPDNLDIVNNTIDNITGDQGAFYISSVQFCDNVRVFNNIFSNNNRSISAPNTADAGLGSAVISFEHNHYYNSTTTLARTSDGNRTLATWKSTVGHETVVGNGRAGEESDPQYVDVGNDNYRLTVGANPEDGGVDILDLDNDASTVDSIHRGAYITGNEQIGQIVAGGGISFSGANILFGPGFEFR